MCSLSALPRGAAHHDAQLLLEWGPRVRSSPRFHVLPPDGHKARSVLESWHGCQGRWREKALKSHFMKRPCSRGPSHEARAADFPFAAHPTRSRGARAQPGLVLTRWEPRGGGIHRGGMAEPLAAKPTSGIFLGGPPLAAVSRASLMQEMKDVHSPWGVCEPGGTGAEREAGRSSSPAVAEADSGPAEARLWGPWCRMRVTRRKERRWQLLFPCTLLPQLAPNHGECG